MSYLVGDDTIVLTDDLRLVTKGVTHNDNGPRYMLHLTYADTHFISVGYYTSQARNSMFDRIVAELGRPRSFYTLEPDS